MFCVGFIHTFLEQHPKRQSFFAGHSKAKSVSSFLITASSLLSLVIGLGSLCEAQSASKVGILHKTPDTRTLPLTSNWMPIAVELTNTKATDLKIRLVGARDGRFIDIALPNGALNEEDRPLYTVEVPAPAATMSYQFIVHQPDGQLSTTNRFTIQRPCVQNFKVEVAGDDSDAQFRREVATLVAKAKQHERDRANLEAASKVLEEIKNNLPG